MTKDNTASPERIVEVRLFGGVRVFHDAQEAVLGAERELKAIAALATNAPTPISRDALAGWIWDELPPRWPDELNRIMAGLRGHLAKAGLHDVLINKNGLCRLEIPKESVDVHRFSVLLHRAKVDTDHQHRSELLRAALELSQGIPMAGTRGQRVESYRTELSDLRNSAELDLIDADIALGRSDQHLVELGRLFRDQPDDTRIAGLNMIALHSVGRRPAALRVYEEHRGSLDQFGLDVAQSLKDLQTELLNKDGVVQLPTGALKITQASTKGFAMSDANEEHNTAREDKTDTQSRIEPPMFDRIIQHAANVTNIGTVHAHNAHIGPSFQQPGWDEDDD
jgi:DNA-binding SARP family transcriptional activator